MVATILHVDIDAFFASVEQVRNPSLRGKPVIVGSGVIASCSYEARAFGLRAGMPLGQARRLCPDAVVLEGHYPTYRCFASKVFQLCRSVAPQVEAHLDEAYCDLTGACEWSAECGMRSAECKDTAPRSSIYGHPSNAGRLLKDAILAETGLTVSVGIGTNRMIAKMAGSSGKPDGLVAVEPGEEDAFVRGLPLEKLPGIGHARLEVLARLNIATIGGLRQLDQATLEALFGADGAALYERCRGRDSRAITEAEIPKSISRETAFHEDTADAAEIEAMLFYLIERAARALRSLGLQARTVGVRIRYSDGKGERASRSLAQPTGLDAELYGLAREILWGKGGECGVRYAECGMGKDAGTPVMKSTDGCHPQRLPLRVPTEGGPTAHPQAWTLEGGTPRGQKSGIYARRAALHSLGIELSRFSRAGERQRGLFEEEKRDKLGHLYACLDRLRQRYGHLVVMPGKSLEALGGLRKDRYGFVLRTPCLTK